uniref:Chloroplast outer envelope protein translocator Toc12 n=1 Tax=Pisum sativum TaxID=3888 RepID=Q5QJD5_PEA|nr:chloroplast outer envelope protein translocator Toc12 [Pisum sativum]
MAATTTAGVIGGIGSGVSWMQFGRKEKKQNKMNTVTVCCSSYSSSVTDPYKILKVQPDASESDVRKAFRQLALQYHPDVCRGKDCDVQFHVINEAYVVSYYYL